MRKLPERIVNIHGHLRLDQNIPERVKLWKKWNIIKFCCLCFTPRWNTSEAGGYFTNEDFVKWKKRYPDMLVGMGSIDLGPFSADTADKVSRLQEQGFEGLKFINPDSPYNHEKYFAFYERAQELDMPILFHTGRVAVCGDGKDGEYGVNSDYMRPYLFDRIARVFPNLKIIGAHFGNPHFNEASAVTRCFANVYYDISGGSGSKPHEYALRRYFMPHSGADMKDSAENPALDVFRKLCFGTDNPEPDVWVPLSQRLLDLFEIPDETRELFWWKNSFNIFRWH